MSRKNPTAEELVSFIRQKQKRHWIATGGDEDGFDQVWGAHLAEKAAATVAKILAEDRRHINEPNPPTELS